MRYRRFNATTIAIMVLLAIGLLSGLVNNPGRYVIPFAVFAIVFLLYKFPPSSFKRKSFGPTFKMKPKPPKKNVTFRVIQGSKRDDDEPPKYH
ncbi:hypothetical protein [Paenibacillus sp. MBLB4367]|uniref:hypothetical protein n=1 Tax=Paenibacillus sp. MBLB4367 TaxID=3384767 RepID=UPI0039083B97